MRSKFLTSFAYALPAMVPTMEPVRKPAEAVKTSRDARGDGQGSLLARRTGDRHATRPSAPTFSGKRRPGYFFAARRMVASPSSANSWVRCRKAAPSSGPQAL